MALYATSTNLRRKPKLALGLTESQQLGSRRKGTFSRIVETWLLCSRNHAFLAGIKAHLFKSISFSAAVPFRRLSISTSGTSPSALTPGHTLELGGGIAVEVSLRPLRESDNAEWLSDLAKKRVTAIAVTFAELRAPSGLSRKLDPLSWARVVRPNPRGRSCEARHIAYQSLSTWPGYFGSATRA